jgi:hypothetical protein
VNAVETLHRHWKPARSTACAVLAAVVLDAALVVLLLHLPLRVELRTASSLTTEAVVSQHITYLKLSPAKAASTAGRIIQSTRIASARSNASPRRSPTTVGTVSRSTNALSASPGPLEERHRLIPQHFKTGFVERSQAEVRDSIIRMGIQPGNDTAARLKRALQDAVDWTVAVHGDKYGVSPGHLHLGKITVRFPLVFAEPLSFSSDRRRGERWTREDTRSQAARAIRDAMFDSSVVHIGLRKLAGEGAPSNSGMKPERE